MKLQTCSPSFFDALDAIIQADQILTGGENFCLLWEGFASRGLGRDATFAIARPEVEEPGQMLVSDLFIVLL